jgi:hypothetical protein
MIVGSMIWYAGGHEGCLRFHFFCIESWDCMRSKNLGAMTAFCEDGSLGLIGSRDLSEPCCVWLQGIANKLVLGSGIIYICCQSSEESIAGHRFRIRWQG